MRWAPFSQASPELAEIAREWLADRHIMLLGTLRPDGSPRISAVECDIVGDDLCTGMIWQSAKALDLLRDPRMTVHSLPPGKDNPAGDLKLYGRAVAVDEPATKRAYEETLYARYRRCWLRPVPGRRPGRLVLAGRPRDPEGVPARTVEQGGKPR